MSTESTAGHRFAVAVDVAMQTLVPRVCELATASTERFDILAVGSASPLPASASGVSKREEAAPTYRYCTVFSRKTGLSTFYIPLFRLAVPCRYAANLATDCCNGGDFIAAVGGLPRVIQHRAPIAAAVEAPGLFGGRRRNICATPMLLHMLLRIFAGMVETQPRCKQALRHAT